MNVRKALNKFRWLWIAMSCMLMLPASAEGLSGLLSDPLRANPPELSAGVVLPGDVAPVPCPPVVDLLQPLILSAAVDLALCGNPQIKAAWAEIKIQAGALGEARAAFLPTLTGSVSELNNRTTYPDFAAANTTVNGHTTYTALDWRLFDFGGRLANHEAANQLLIAALASHDAILQKILTSVIGTYFDALTANAMYTAKNQATRLASNTLQATQRKEVKGAAGRNDSLQAMTAMAKAQLAEQRALGDYRKAISTLIYTIALPAGTRVVLPFEVQMSAPEGIDELSHWLKVAQEKHPAIITARAQWEAAKSKVDSVRSDGLPTLDFVANYYQNGYPNQGLQLTRSNTTTIGMTLNIPLFDGFARTYKIHEAQAQAEQSEAQMQDTEHQILGEVVKAYADAQSALANLGSSDTLLQAAQTAIVSSQHRYTKGVGDILELLSVQSALADAQQERVRSLAEWRSARFKLMANAGVLGRDLIADQDNLRSGN